MFWRGEGVVPYAQYVSFFLKDHNGNETVQLFCAILFAIDFLIVFGNSKTIL